MGGGNKVIWLYQLNWKCKLATIMSCKALMKGYRCASLWWRANAQNVSFSTRYGGQFTFSTYLVDITKLSFWSAILDDVVFSMNTITAGSVFILSPADALYCICAHQKYVIWHNCLTDSMDKKPWTWKMTQADLYSVLPDIQRILMPQKWSALPNDLS